MPTSHPHQIGRIVELMMLTQPNSLLDVGVGFGKYGFLAREYLDAGETMATQGSRRRIDGIEGYSRYIGPVHGLVYDEIHIGNALEVLPTLPHRYDLLILIDVLEHLDHAQGMRLLDLARKAARNVLVSTPTFAAAQEAVFGNELEIHRAQWMRNDFRAFSPRFFVPDNYSIICYFGEDAVRVYAQIRKHRRLERLRRIMGFKGYYALRRLMGFGTPPQQAGQSGSA